MIPKIRRRVVDKQNPSAMRCGVYRNQRNATHTSKSTYMIIKRNQEQKHGSSKLRRPIQNIATNAKCKAKANKNQEAVEIETAYPSNGLQANE